MQTWGSTVVPGVKQRPFCPEREDIRRRIEHVCLVANLLLRSSHPPATSQLTIMKYQFDSQTAFLNDAS
jgi:hypothetical protein